MGYLERTEEISSVSPPRAPASAHTTTEQETYSYDNSGILITKEVDIATRAHTYAYKTSTRYVYTYDNYGNVVRIDATENRECVPVLYWECEQPDTTIKWTTIYEYDANGNLLIEKRADGANGTFLPETVYFYDDYDNLLRVYSYRRNSDRTYSYACWYE
jgi:hypothetical protein